MQGNTFKVAAVAALLLISLWKLFPTVQNIRTQGEMADMTPEARAAYTEANSERITATQEQALTLGLDLQGGMAVTLEVGANVLLRELAQGRTDDVFDAALTRATEEARTSRDDFVTIFVRALETEREGTLLARYFRNPAAGINARSSNADVEEYLRLEVGEALTRAEEIVRQRIDRFGVAEPSIQRQGSNRIVVELPGVSEPERVRSLLRGAAQLSFRLTPEPQAVAQSAQRVVQYFAQQETGTTPAPAADTTAASADTAGATTAAATDSAAALDVAALTGTAPAATSAATPGARRFADMFIPSQEGGPVFGQVAQADTGAVRRMLAASAVQGLLPAEAVLMYESAPSGQTADGQGVYRLLAVNRRVELAGEVVTDARPEFDPYTNAPQVSLTMNSEGAGRWRQITSSNIGRPVAVVLDDAVYTFPTINGTIPNGRTQITGSFSRQEVDDIVTVLKSGALPAPVNIVEERTVGPSLGAASTRAGLRSLLIGFLLVCAFMAVYYKGGGVIAVVALVLNVLFIFGVLATFGATLTLPGMAGIVLTIGMAVDANVLIFERIREEIDAGKTLRAAVDGGFEKALSSIADANITTFLIGVILYSFGVGPIQGFAVTLMAGILTSLFSALVVTRLVVNYLVIGRGQRVAFG